MKITLTNILLLIILLLLVLNSIFLFILWKKASNGGNKMSENGEIKQEQLIEKKLGPIISLDSFIVNLNDLNNRKYLRVTMELEIDSEENKEEINKRLPQIRDIILTILPSKKYEEITTAEGKNKLRDEIQKELNSIFDKELIKKIYFTEFVIQ